MIPEYDVGQTVWLKIGKRPAISIRIIERTADGRYLLDWGACGFNSLLNTVGIPHESLSTSPQS